jgi:hypothetical protein
LKENKKKRVLTEQENPEKIEMDQSDKRSREVTFQYKTFAKRSIQIEWGSAN